MALNVMSAPLSRERRAIFESPLSYVSLFGSVASPTFPPIRCAPPSLIAVQLLDQVPGPSDSRPRGKESSASRRAEMGEATNPGLLRD